MSNANKQNKTVKFFSKAENYKILVKPTVLDVKNNIPVLSHGEKIEFKNNEYSTNDAKVIEFLRAHKAYGVDFVEDKTPNKEVS